jgi:hypothetical protein
MLADKEYRDLVSRFRDSLQKAADHLEMPPRMVTRDQFNPLIPKLKLNLSRDKDVDKNGFAKLKDAAFPPEKFEVPPNGRSEYVDEVLVRCAAVYKQPKHEITASQFYRFIKFVYGENAVGIAKDAMTKNGGFPTIRDAHNEIHATPQTVAKRRLIHAAKMNRKLGAKAADDQFILDRIQEYVSQLYKEAFNVTICCKPPTKQKGIKRAITLVLSDDHFGSDIDARETGSLNYGRIEEARRLSAVVKHTAEYKVDYREETELEILILGDIIQGALHDPRDGAVLAEQIARAIHLLTLAVIYLSAHFPSVKVRIVPGNHDRFVSRHKQRAVNQKWDSIMWVIGFAIQNAIAGKCKTSPSTCRKLHTSLTNCSAVKYSRHTGILYWAAPWAIHLNQFQWPKLSLKPTE